ncbi:MAG TPA: ATP-dependent DNA helicase RecG [Trebonia sp.]|nr:ATP-dependent DNA helicase RecG [Trebonia sp.]
MATLSDPLEKILGERASAPLAKAFGIITVGDLLRHYPRRYYTRGELTELALLHEHDHVTVMARVASARRVGAPSHGGSPYGGRGRQRLEVAVTDGLTMLPLTFFGGIPKAARDLKEGRLGLFAGTVSVFRGRKQLVHPEYEIVPESTDAEGAAAEYVSRLVPVYPASAKASSWMIARAIETTLARTEIPDDLLPEALRERHGLIGQYAAFEGVHRPRERSEVNEARKRLKWDEAVVLQAALAQRRMAAAAMPAVPRPPAEGGLAARFDELLPFTLTDGQREVGDVIAADLAAASPMNRLLQGEVGSGKTIVALRAMLQVVDAGGQAALLAPTEVLAQQHYRSITAMLGPLAAAGQLHAAEHATRVALLTGSTGVRQRRSALADVVTGDAGILVGTHALIEDRVQFADLGLVVIDEQHRFGVEQRDALREKASGARPHVLVMTATPIPRTVAMTVFGDLEVSTLTELPAGRSPITTHVVPATERPRFLDRAWERMREEVAAGRQGYVVCPRIGDAGEGEAAGAADDAGTRRAAPGQEGAGQAGAGKRGENGAADGPDDPDDWLAGGAPPDDDEEDARRPPLAVLDVAAALEEGPLAGLRLAILHGRMHPEEKDRVMSAFKEGSLDVLVSTTVIEVGVDVPNSTVMVVMDADRFGVSQLHQLRGRIGRGQHPGLCLLVTEAAEASPARERLDAVAATADGFELSRLDLEQRKEGDVLGAAQAGRRSSLKLLQLLRDEELIARARQEATAVVAEDPWLERHPALSGAIDAILGDQRAEFLDKS